MDVMPDQSPSPGVSHRVAAVPAALSLSWTARPQRRLSVFLRTATASSVGYCSLNPRTSTRASWLSIGVSTCANDRAASAEKTCPWNGPVLCSESPSNGNTSKYAPISDAICMYAPFVSPSHMHTKYRPAVGRSTTTLQDARSGEPSRLPMASECSAGASAPVAPGKSLVVAQEYSALTSLSRQSLLRVKLLKGWRETTIVTGVGCTRWTGDVAVQA
mmetsp:Transcript_26796/g.69402  ORF Transcript_26796/g.69402 Transcript_26796/m.69402 type:complete len:217 (-) Transcript_26796:873-1523(-)